MPDFESLPQCETWARVNTPARGSLHPRSVEPVFHSPASHRWMVKRSKQDGSAAYQSAQSGHEESLIESVRKDAGKEANSEEEKMTSLDS